MRIGLVALVAVLFGAEAQAAKLIAVLPLDVSHTKGKLDADGSALLEEVLRDAAANALGTAGWTVLTGETTLQIIKDNGVSPDKCGDESCHLQMARELKVEKFLSGSVQFVDGEFTAVIRAIDSRTGTILASEMIEGATVSALRKDFHAKAATFFSRSGLVGALPPAAATPAPAPAPVVGGVPRDLWVQRVNERLASMICSGAYFAHCFLVPLERCVEVATPISLRCSQEITPQLPASFNETNGREWGSKIGQCSGERLENALLTKKNPDPKCNDASQWQ